MIFKYFIKAAHAQELIPCEDGSYADPSIGCAQVPAALVNPDADTLSIVLSIAEKLVDVGVIASAGFLIYGGIFYALSVGNELKIQKAKRVIFWSIFGLILTLLAKYIVSAILLFITQ